jgi:hypothetical protein
LQVKGLKATLQRAKQAAEVKRRKVSDVR